MTDKQMEEKKKEFMGLGMHITRDTGEQFLNGENDWVYAQKDTYKELWQWISKLVEEVEREGYKKGLIDQSIRDVTN